MSNNLTPAQERKREKNRRYWAEREKEALKHYIQEEKEYDKQIAQIYKRMIDACNTEIASFYGRYASKEGITLAEAKKRVSQLDIEAYERKAKQYVKERNFSKQANEEMRLYNAVMKINRLEMLKANIGLELIKGHDDLNAFMSDILQGRTVEELERQAGILGETINENAKLAHTIPNASFHNATFSQRIWANQTVLRNEISSLLQTGLIQGKNPRVLARELRKKVDTSQYNAERLMRTELARVQTAAQKASLESMNIELYQFHANSGCCDICRAVAARDTGYSETGVYKVASMMPGENASPLHPNCRCSVSPYSDEAEYQAWLDNLEKGTDLTYTDVSAIQNYMSANAYIINEKLRTGQTLSEIEQENVSNLDKALLKMPKYSGDLSRSLYFDTDEDIEDFLRDYKSGGIINYTQYISTTKGDIYNPKGQVQILIINTKNGRDISELNSAEKEVLYQRNSSFHILSIVEKNGKYYILLEESENNE